jgi:hypothetical protein
MRVRGASSDGVWYYANSSYTAFEWRTRNAADDADVYQFTLEYSTDAPGTFLYTYYLLGYLKSFATIGIQGNVNSKFVSFDSV